jgi:hypothetical protein
VCLHYLGNLRVKSVPIGDTPLEKAVLNRSASSKSGQQIFLHTDSWTDSLEGDPRWSLAQSVAAGNHFVRSPLLSRFLLYVVAETLMGRQTGITEHQIGIHVFGRPRTYRTDEDNIVRNYARQLRKRLAEHFIGDDCSNPMRIEIPVGGYVPVFTRIPEPEVKARADTQSDLKDKKKTLPHLQPAMEAGARTSSASEPRDRHFLASRFIKRFKLSGKLAVVAYSAVLVFFTWLVASRVLVPQPAPEPARTLWKTILRGSNNTYIVPPDAGLNLLEDMSSRPLPLADYIKGSYRELSLPTMDDQTARDMRTQQFTDFVSLQIVDALAQQQEYDSRRVVLRFPRDLRLDDLKTTNVVIIGSASSNPWAAIADSETNFRIVPTAGMQGASIVNTRPQPGEATSYVSRWNEPAHETYALISLIPNLSGNGHMLFLEGLDVAGTQSAAELLFHSGAIAPILDRALRPDGSLRPFEILLRSTSIESNAAGSQIVAIRIH